MVTHVGTLRFVFGDYVFGQMLLPVVSRKIPFMAITKNKNKNKKKQKTKKKQTTSQA